MPSTETCWTRSARWTRPQPYDAMRACLAGSPPRRVQRMPARHLRTCWRAPCDECRCACPRLASWRHRAGHPGLYVDPTRTWQLGFDSIASTELMRRSRALLRLESRRTFFEPGTDQLAGSCTAFALHRQAFDRCSRRFTLSPTCRRRRASAVGCGHRLRLDRLHQASARRLAATLIAARRRAHTAAVPWRSFVRRAFPGGPDLEGFRQHLRDGDDARECPLAGTGARCGAPRVPLTT